MKVARVDVVEVDEADAADARRGEVERRPDCPARRRRRSSTDRALSFSCPASPSSGRMRWRA